MHLFQIVCRVFFTQYKGIGEYLNNTYTEYQLSTGIWLSQNRNSSFAWSEIFYNGTIYILHARLFYTGCPCIIYISFDFKMTTVHNYKIA